jgi:hypothetical protein
MAYSTTPGPGPVKAFQGREEVLPGGAGSSEETTSRRISRPTAAAAVGGRHRDEGTVWPSLGEIKGF